MWVVSDQLQSPIALQSNPICLVWLDSISVEVKFLGELGRDAKLIFHCSIPTCLYTIPPCLPLFCTLDLSQRLSHRY